MVTNTAAAAAGLTWMALSWAETGKPSAMATATGAVCGLVAIMPASGLVGPMASIAIGVIAGVVTYVMLLVRSKKTRIDDTLDVWAAHGMGGVAGAILTGVFAEQAINSAGANELLFGNPRQLVIQLLAVVASLAYSFVVSYLLLRLLSRFGLRVTPEEESTGLDGTRPGHPRRGGLPPVAFLIECDQAGQSGKTFPCSGLVFMPDVGGTPRRRETPGATS
jgi:ammonium transporter, Amt family